MKKPISPCYKCEDRVVGCHGRCERYQEYTGEMEKIREERVENSEREFHSHSKLSKVELNKRSKKWQ